MVNTMDCPIYLYRMSVESELNFYKNIGEIKLPGSILTVIDYNKTNVSK